VIDEFHHAEAATYRRILDHLRPLELLGLTATPERADGVDVRSFFDNRTAYELPLWEALAADLLVPFHYFGVADDVDLSAVEWKRGAYDIEGLDQLYTGNDARAVKVLRELRDKVTDVGRMRALGFCVSVAHAQYMARVFREAGIPSLAVFGMTSARERAAAIDGLRRGNVNALLAADLFNEGLDIPEVDTVLFLRPTQSATIFLQQLGRGPAPGTRQSGADGARLHRPAPPRVPLRRPLPRPHRNRTADTRARHRARLPVLAVRLADRAR
jgi:superfamily II DNA or RNA helicase